MSTPNEASDNSVRDRRGRYQVPPSVWQRFQPQWYAQCLIVSIGAVGGLSTWLAWLFEAVVLVTGIVGLLGVIAGGAIAVWLRQSTDRSWALSCSIAATVWLLLAAATGIGWGLLAILLLVGNGLAWPWYRRHQIANPRLHGPVPEPVATQPVKPVADENGDTHVDQVALDWHTYLAGDGDPLRGSYLTNRKDINAGVRYCAMLVRGRQTWQTALNAQANIAGALDTTSDKIVVEKGETEARATITFVQRSPVATEPIAFIKPEYVPELGAIRIGTFVDGEGDPVWRLYTEDSIWGGFITGGTGMGKSRLMDILAMSMMSSGNTLVWYGDPQMGASSGMLSKHADWAVRGITGIKKMLRTVEKIVEWRQQQNAAHKWDGFTPSAGLPGIVIILDESHLALADPEIAAIVELIGRVARKLGIALILASQVATLDAFGKGNSADAIRAAVCAGNAAALKTDSNNTKTAISDLEVNPVSLPAIPGYTFLVDKSTDATGRTAPLRTFRLPRDPDTLSRIWAEAAACMPGLDNAAANIAGADYARRHEIGNDDLASIQAYVARIESGVAAAEPVQSSLDLQPIDVPTAALPPNVDAVSFPGFVVSEELLNTPATAALSSESLTQSQQMVLQAIADGATTPAAQQRATGWSEKHCRNLRDQLVEAGLVERNGHGNYTAIIHTQAA